MKVLFDTSVLVAAMVESHPGHRRALPWLQGAKSGRVTFLVTAHTLAELYAVLTRLPYGAPHLAHRCPPLPSAWSTRMSPPAPRS